MSLLVGFILLNGISDVNSGVLLPPGETLTGLRRTRVFPGTFPLGRPVTRALFTRRDGWTNLVPIELMGGVLDAQLILATGFNSSHLRSSFPEIGIIEETGRAVLAIVPPETTITNFPRPTLGFYPWLADWLEGKDSG